MDFLDPKKKRAHRIRLYVGYGLMAVALAIATIILLFAAYGYDIDRTTGGIIQNGMVILDAHPDSATVYANGEQKGTTATRLALPAGQYKIELKRDGYRLWSHLVNLEGSSIEQLVYPFLFPQKLVSKNLQQYTAPPQVVSQSPDRHWLVVSAPSPGNFQVIDLNNDKNPVTNISLPADTITTAPGVQTYEAIEWSSDNTHLLLKHGYQGGSEFVMLDRENPTNSVNITKLFTGTAFTSASLRDKKADQFYLHTADGKLYTAETKSKKPELVVEKVAQYKSYQGDTLLYALQPTTPTASVTEIHYRQGSEDYVLRTVPKAATYLLDMAQFNGHFYIAAGSTADGHTYIYKDPLDDYRRRPARTPQPNRVLIVNGAQYVSFSAIARFIAVQAGSGFAVYDAETGRQFKYDTKLTLVPGQKATWMDGHRLLLASNNTQYVFDFDGTNMQKLNAAHYAYPPFFDRDYTALFTLAPQNNNLDQPVLTRTELKVTSNTQ